jgi:hypothetical protein
LLTPLNENPIALAELNYQNRSQVRNRRWLHWINRITKGSAYLLAFVMITSEIVEVIFYNIGTTGYNLPSLITRALGILVGLPIGVVIMLHFRRMFQTLSQSTHSIIRERQSNKWDLLILTGIDARKLVLGKWWATVRYMGRYYIVLGVLRAVLVIWIGRHRNYFYSYYTVIQPNVAVITPTLWQMLLSGTIVFLLAIANLLFTAACGVSAFNKHGGVALARAIATRLFILIGTVITLGLISQLIYTLSYQNDAASIGAISLITLLDNGVVVGSQLATYSLSNYNPAYGSGVETGLKVFLPAAVLALIIYALLTWILLRSAQNQAVRQGALPPLSRKSVGTP